VGGRRRRARDREHRRHCCKGYPSHFPVVASALLAPGVGGALDGGTSSEPSLRGQLELGRGFKARRTACGRRRVPADLDCSNQWAEYLGHELIEARRQVAADVGIRLQAVDVSPPLVGGTGKFRGAAGNKGLESVEVPPSVCRAGKRVVCCQERLSVEARLRLGGGCVARSRIRG